MPARASDDLAILASMLCQPLTLPERVAMQGKLRMISDRVRALECPVAEPIAATVHEIIHEVTTAEAKWPPMNSAHEAFAVLNEEVDELWDHVKTKQANRDLPSMRKECVQVAAMAVRFIRDICDGRRHRA